MKKNLVREMRKQKGYSQLKLGRMTEIAPNTISNIENGKIVAYPGWRKKLAAALEISESELFPEYVDDEKEV